MCKSLGLIRTLVVVAASLPCAMAAAADSRPSIVVILSDDMGFSDIGCYGGEINTPNLDGLAAGGLRFTQFYNTARCCPTRASLLTGLYPHQAGIGHMMEDKGLDAYRGNLNRKCVTMAEAIRNCSWQHAASGRSERGPAWMAAIPCATSCSLARAARSVTTRAPSRTPRRRARPHRLAAPPRRRTMTGTCPSNPSCHGWGSPGISRLRPRSPTIWI